MATPFSPKSLDHQTSYDEKIKANPLLLYFS